MSKTKGIAEKELNRGDKELKMKKRKENVFVSLASTNHSQRKREANDYYATDPKDSKKFIKRIKEDNIEIKEPVWECAVGGGHLRDVLELEGYSVVGSDIIDRGGCDKVLDFLELEKKPFICGDIISNPPYKHGLEFVKKSMDLLEEGEKSIFMLKIQFLEGVKRGEYYLRNNPKYIYVHSSRANCARSGLFDTYKSSAVCYAWFIFEKGFKGESIVRWIP